MSETILVTGAAGFIASHFCDMILSDTDASIVAVDNQPDFKESMRLQRLVKGHSSSPARLRVVDQDLRGDISELLEGVTQVVHFAAKTFVDHSFRSPMSHVQNNIVATANLLEQCRQFKPKVFVHISTDEVYGPAIEYRKCGNGYNENCLLNPTNPYSATKAATEQLVTGWSNAFGFPAIITRCENNYGPWQHKQKVLPTFIRKALDDEKLPVYGDGQHSRMWLHVFDHCEAIKFLMDKGETGIFNIGSRQELTNLELAEKVLVITGRPTDRIEFIDDTKIRPVHDRRYDITTRKLEDLGWKAKRQVDTELAKTIMWYVESEWWLR